MASSTFITTSSFKPLTVPFYSNTLPSLSTPSSLGFRTNFRRCLLKVNAVSTKLDPSKVVPQADRVLIRLEELAQKSAGGVLLPKSAVKFERYLMGEILAVGAEAGGLETGKKVLFSDISAYEVDLGADGRHVFCKASDLLAVVG